MATKLTLKQICKILKNRKIEISMNEDSILVSYMIDPEKDNSGKGLTKKDIQESGKLMDRITSIFQQIS